MTATALLEFRDRIASLSSDEKLQLLEVLWEEVSRNERNFESPAWHAEELRKTEERVAAGLETFHDWDDVKARLLGQLDKQ